MLEFDLSRARQHQTPLAADAWLMREIDSYLAGMPCLRTIKLYFRTGVLTPEPDTKDLVGRIRKQLLMFFPALYESGVAVQFSLSPENVVVEFGSEDY